MIQYNHLSQAASEIFPVLVNYSVKTNPIGTAKGAKSKLRSHLHEKMKIKNFEFKTPSQ